MRIEDFDMELSTIWPESVRTVVVRVQAKKNGQETSCTQTVQE